MHERLLHKSNLILSKMDKICHAAESMAAQMKVVGNSAYTLVSTVSIQKNKLSTDKGAASSKPTRDCWNCGRRHQFYTRELCPAFGKICAKCKKPNPFTAKCHTHTSELHKGVKAVDDDNLDEVFPQTFQL